MTVNTEKVVQFAVPDGVTAVVDCPGLVALKESDVRVRQFDAGGVEVAVPAFSVAGLGSSSGITVTAVAPFTADATGVVVVERVSEALQGTEIEDFLSRPGETEEAGLDRLTLLAQEVRRLVGRAVRLHPADNEAFDELPRLSSLLGRVLGVTADGKLTGLLAVPAGSVSFSTLGQNLAGAANQASARALIGAAAALDLANLATTVANNALLHNATACGRLTLTSGVPVMVTDTLDKSVVYFTPFRGRVLPIWDGAKFAVRTFTELSNDLTQAATGKAGPAAATGDKNYDLFYWDDAGTLRLTRGPLWSSNTARGVGAGTSELQTVQGVEVNKFAIVNGPAAGAGTYVGTIRTNALAKVDFKLGGLGTGGVAAVIGLWNRYNRLPVTGLVGDTTNAWSYGTAAWRAANASNAMRVSVVAGLQEDVLRARYDALAYTNAGSGGSEAAAGIGFDSVTVASGSRQLIAHNSGSGTQTGSGEFAATMLGFHYMQAIEYCGFNTGNNAFVGARGVPDVVQTGLTYEWWF